MSKRKPVVPLTGTWADGFADWSNEYIREEIQKEYARWNEIATHGSSDPHWPDGTGLYLTRNHILFYYSLLHERGLTTMTLFGDFPEERPVPPEVTMQYMVRDGTHAKRLSGKYRDTDLIWGYSGQYAV